MFFFEHINSIQTNANAILGFKFIHEMIKLFKSYFGGNLSVDAIKNNFVLIYELLDEIMDNGVPQVRGAILDFVRSLTPSQDLHVLHIQSIQKTSIMD